jgi:predicted metal-dependent hydrolase
MKPETLGSINLQGRKVDYRLVRSKSAKKLRVRVGPGGVEVIQPQGREDDVAEFLTSNGPWILDQLKRVERLRSIRRPQREGNESILFRGELTPVRVEEPQRGGANRVVQETDCLLIVRGRASQTPPAKSLENWLRRQARLAIEQQLEPLAKRLKQAPGRVYIMDQRTRWGNCSALRNLSFNWRLILAPDFVLKYLVTHEAVHLAVPDHSRRFWLTVQSLCPETERARQWLCANAHRLRVDLSQVCAK